MSLIQEATLFVTVKANDEASAATKNMTSSFSGLAKAALAVGAAAVIAGVVAIGVGGVKSAIDMQTAVTSLAAQADITVGKAGDISKAFLSTTGDSIYSARTMIAAYTPVSAQFALLQGHALSAAQALGVMKASGDLAEASGESLTSTTSDLAKIMQAYQIPLKDAAGASNVLFNASRVTGTSLGSLTQSLARVRSQMGASAPPLTTMGGLLVDLTAHGETGRAAIASLGSAFTGIISPTAAVTKAQQAMGLSFTNATTGALLPMSTIFSELQPKLAGMSSAVAAATLKTLGFGQASVKLAETIQAGPAVLQKYTTQVNATNSAHLAAEKQAKTLGHQVDVLKASFSNVEVEIGQVLLPVLIKLMDAVMGFIKPMLDWIQTHTKLVVVIGGVAAALSGLVLVALAYKKIMQASKLVGDMFNDMQKITQVRSIAVTAATNVQKAAVAAWGVVTKAGTLIQAGFDAVMDANPIVLVGIALAALVTGLVLFVTKTTLGRDILKDVTGVLSGIFHDAITAAGIVIAAIVAQVKAWISILQTVYSWISTNVGKIAGFFQALPADVKAVWTTMSSDVSTFISDVVGFFAGLPAKIVKALGSLAGDVGNVLKSIPVVGGLFSAAGSVLGHLATGGKALPGNSYMVGENGPEILQMTGSGGVVTPVTGGSAGGMIASSASPIGGSAAVGGGSGAGTSSAITVPVTLMVDGQVLAKVVAKKQGQALRHQGLVKSGGNS